MTSCCEMILLYARRMLSAAGSIVEMYYFIADVFLSPCVRKKLPVAGSADVVEMHKKSNNCWTFM